MNRELFKPKQVHFSVEEQIKMNELTNEFIKSNKVKYFKGTKEVTKEEFYKKEPFTVEPLVSERSLKEYIQ